MAQLWFDLYAMDAIEDYLDDVSDDVVTVTCLCPQGHKYEVVCLAGEAASVLMEPGPCPVCEEAALREFWWPHQDLVDLPGEALIPGLDFELPFPALDPESPLMVKALDGEIQGLDL